MKQTQFKMVLLGLAEYYKTTLTENQLKMYSDDLMCLSESELFEAVQKYRLQQENIFFPLPAKLIAIIKPVESEIDIGRVVSGRIITAISKYGYNNKLKAEEFIGDLGWQVVKYQGGWLSICELTSDQIRDEQPRWRDLAVTLNKRSLNGKIDEAPQLEKSRNEIVKLINTTFKDVTH